MKQMYRLSIVLMIGFLIACHSPKPKSKKGNHIHEIKEKVETEQKVGISDQELDEGFEKLFDGLSKQGWHIYNNGSDGAAWEVKNGELFLNALEVKITPVLGAGDLTQAVGGGDLVSDKEYDNFHLKMEWKISELGNSGVMIFVNENESNDYPWQTGPEIQIIDVEKECKPKFCPGDLYGLAAGPANRELSNEWNQMEVISKEENLEVILNGQSLYKIRLWDDNWNATIAQTKFTNWPEFGTFKKGSIVLQDHGHKVWYRNIRIKEL